MLSSLILALGLSTSPAADIESNVEAEMMIEKTGRLSKMKIENEFSLDINETGRLSKMKIGRLSKMKINEFNLETEEAGRLSKMKIGRLSKMKI